MPGIAELEKLSQSYGIAIAVLIIVCIGLVYAVVALYRDNRTVYGRLESVLHERIKVLEAIVSEENHARNR